MSEQVLQGSYGYDGANDSRSRSLLLFPCNARSEFQSFTRRRLQEKNRALEANFGFITRIKSKFGRGVVGRGIFPTAVTTDPEWNKRADALIESWGSNPAVYSSDGSVDMWEDQRIAAEELGAGDGEIFRMVVNVPGMPMAIQPIDPFEVGSTWGMAPDGYVDGVKCDAMLRRLGYLVAETGLSPLGRWTGASVNYREVAARDMIHIFKRRRANQVRGLPPLYSVINDGNDVLDMVAMEKAADKLHSLLAVAKTVKEENKGRGLGGQISRLLDAEGNPAGKLEKFPQAAVTVELDQNEQLQLLSSSRPGRAWLDGVTFYCRFIALGTDLPLSVVLSFAEVGGTQTRAELEDAQNTFDMKQDQVVWKHSQPIRLVRLAKAMQSGELPMCKDPEWWKCDWQGPAKMTVDYGRSAQANIDLMKSGMFSVPRYCDERSWRWQDEQDKQIAWLKRGKERCDAEGVDFMRYLEATPGAQQKISVNTGAGE